MRCASTFLLGVDYDVLNDMHVCGSWCTFVVWHPPIFHGASRVSVLHPVCNRNGICPHMCLSQLVVDCDMPSRHTLYERMFAAGANETQSDQKQAKENDGGSNWRSVS